MKRVAVLFIVFLFVSLVVYGKAGTQDVTALEQKPKVGYVAPYFSLQGLDGKTYQVAGKREKPLVINFWASWCGPCQAEAPDLREVSLKYKDDVDFYAINSTSNDKLDKAKEFVSHFQLPFPIPLDEKGEVTNLYQVNAFPTTFFVDRNGVITEKVLGMMNRADLEAKVKKLAGK